MADRPILIGPRGTEISIPELGMRSELRGDAQAPQPLEGSVDGWWFGICMFEGTSERGQGGSQTDVEIVGTFTLAVTDERMLCIVDPDPEAAALMGVSPHGTDLDACVWISIPVRELDATAYGQRGLIRKRPNAIEINGPRWRLAAREVNWLFPSGRAQRSQEAQLVAALTPQ